MLRRVGRLQPRHLPQPERAALHRRRQRQPRAPAGRRRGHAGLHAQPDAASSRQLPRAKVLGVVNFPTFHAAMDAAQHIVKLGPTAVELVDRTMIELALRQPGVPADDRDGADRRSRRRSCWSSSRATTRPRCCRKLKRPGRADGRPRPAGQRGRDARRRAAEEPVGGAQGRPQHHDEPEGRRQAGQLHRGLRGAARAPGRVHRRADRGVRAPRHARHLVRARLGRHAARAADPRHARATARAKMRAIAEEAARAGAQVQGRLQRRARRRPVPRRVDRVAVRPGASTTRSAPSSSSSTRSACSTPARSSIRRRWTTRALFRFRRRRATPYDDRRCKPALDWSAWNVQNDPVTEAITRARQRRRHHRRLRQGRRDVQQQRPLPQVRRRHHVPELPRHARRAAPDARPRQHAAARAVGPARPRRASPARRCTRRWTCASAARAASATARPASTWRG